MSTIVGKVHFPKFQIELDHYVADTGVFRTQLNVLDEVFFENSLR